MQSVTCDIDSWSTKSFTRMEMHRFFDWFIAITKFNISSCCESHAMLETAEESEIIIYDL